MTASRRFAPLPLLALAACNQILGVEDRTLARGDGGAGGGATGSGATTATQAGGGGSSPCAELECASGCVDPFTSQQHCGLCDHACAEGTPCINGICGRRLRTNPSSYTQCARTDSDLVCWGSDNFGQMGDGTFAFGDDLPAAVVTATPSDGVSVVAASAIRSTCATLEDGRLSCFGRNQSGSLGIGSVDGGPDDAADAGCCHVVEAVSPLLPPDFHGVDVAGGGWWEREEFYCALGASRDVYCWGNGATVPLKKLEGALQVEAGMSFACALRVGGEVWCWIPPPESKAANPVALGTPFRVEGLPRIRAIGVSHAVGYAIDVDGEVWAWGPSAYALLGPGTPVDGAEYYPPRPFGFTFQSPVVQITGSHVSSCALLLDGDVYCWGKNGWQGDGTPDDGGYDPTPKKVFTENIVEIAASDFDVAARHANGQILRWGAQRSTPTPQLLP